MYAVVSQLIKQRNGVRWDFFLQNILLGHFLKIHFYEENLVHIASQISGKNANK